MTVEIPDTNLNNKMWRMNNLYHIINKDGQEVTFKMNHSQAILWEEMHRMNCILKARQKGFCLDPDTRVLTADLQWVYIKDLKAGDEIVAVDEHVPGGKGKARKMRTAVVLGAVEVYREAYRITFDDGRDVVCYAMGCHT